LLVRLGETTAVIVEAPIMVAASWFVCRWSVDRLDVKRTVPARSLMGLIAFLVLMSAEVGLGALFGRSLVDQLATYGSLAGAIGLGAQVILPCSRSFTVGGGRRRSEKDAALRTAAHSSTEGVQLTNLVADIPSVRDSNSPKSTHLGLGQESSGVRAPQYKISHLVAYDLSVCIL
jgi:hypothetical protein